MTEWSNDLIPNETTIWRLYTILIEGTTDAENAFVQVFFTWADDIDEAIAKVVTAAKSEEGIVNRILFPALAPDNTLARIGTAFWPEYRCRYQH